MELFNWISYPSEYRYLITIFGCSVSPSLRTLQLIREYTTIYQHYPSIDQFLTFVVKECNCEYFIPFGDLLNITKFSLIEYGFIPTCNIAHAIHSFRVFEHRYPDIDEIQQLIQQLLQGESQESQDIQDVQQQIKQSGLTEQDIYKYVQTNEEKDQVCCICQDEIKYQDLVIKLQCNHTFHRGYQYKLTPEDAQQPLSPFVQGDCVGIEEWLKRSATCPICRAAVSKAN